MKKMIMNCLSACLRPVLCCLKILQDASRICSSCDPIGSSDYLSFPGVSCRRP